MSETILVNMGPQETRVVLLENGSVQDIQVERNVGRGLVGNIYCGKVVRVLPGMQAAFVEFGAQRTGFIHISKLAKVAGANQPGDSGRRQAIEYQLRAGQQLVVQVTRDPLGSKGARLSAELALSSRYLVFLQGSTRQRVSQRITVSQERTRLLSLLRQGLAEEGLEQDGGYIVRTAAQGADLAGLRTDLRYLQRLRQAIDRRSRETGAPRLLNEELPLHLRVARDLAGPDLEGIIVDNSSGLMELRSFCAEYVPELAGLVQEYAASIPLFEQYGVETAIEGALDRRVELACGGYLIFDLTESMTTIDVNSGSFVGAGGPETTVLQTNLEAAAELARQLRLRNLGGIIVVDFIDMADSQQSQQVQHLLREELQRDPVGATFTGMSGLGLGIISRKRSGKSLLHTLCDECSHCHGKGMLKSARTVCYEIVTELNRLVPAGDDSGFVVEAAPAVVELLQEEASAALAELKSGAAIAIHLRSQPLFSQEHFDIAMI